MKFGLLSIQTGINELRSPRFWRDVVCEFVVEFLLLAIVTMAVASGVHFWPGQAANTSTLIIALSGGLYVFVLVEAFGHIQWSVMNPVVGLVFVCTKRITIIRYLLYLIADLAGAYTGAAFVFSCMPSDVRGRFKPLGPGPAVSPVQAMGIEALLTMGNMCVIMGALDDSVKKVYMPGLPIGLTVTVGCLVGAPFSGPAMNPAVAFPFAALCKNWQHHWIYWCGDYLGGTIAIGLYALFVYDKGIFIIIDEQKEEDLSCSETDENMNKIKELSSNRNRDHATIKL